MQNISTTLSIDQSRLDGREYMASLMAAALECGILNQDDAQRISGGLMALLQQQTDLLTAVASARVSRLFESYGSKYTRLSNVKLAIVNAWSSRL